MSMTPVRDAPDTDFLASSVPPRRRVGAHDGRRWLPTAYVGMPALVLVLFLLLPLLMLFLISFGLGIANQDTAWSVHAYENVLTSALYWKVAGTTILIATVAMLVQLVVGVPLAYVLAFKAGRFEIPLLLGLVVLDGLNPVIRIYAWRILLGRNGIINGALTSLGIIDEPLDALLFNEWAVIVVLATSWLTYTVIPLYAAMKAIDGRLFQAAADLGASWWTTTRRVLLPLAAPGIFVAVLLVYIPLFTDFATPTLVGGTRGYMLGQAVSDLIIKNGDLASGSAMSFILLFVSGIVAALAFRFSKVKRLQT